MLPVRSESRLPIARLRQLASSARGEHTTLARSARGGRALCEAERLQLLLALRTAGLASDRVAGLESRQFHPSSRLARGKRTLCAGDLLLLLVALRTAGLPSRRTAGLECRPLTFAFGGIANGSQAGL